VTATDDLSPERRFNEAMHELYGKIVRESGYTASTTPAASTREATEKRVVPGNPHVTATVYADALPGRDDLAAAAWEKFQKDAKPAKTAAKARKSA
jgi:hypothetical protein